MLIPLISLIFLHLAASAAVVPYGVFETPVAAADVKTAGLPIDIVQAPFNAAILEVVDTITRHHCGGAIIRADTILTSGFCIYYSLSPSEYPHRLLVKAGTTFYGFGGQQIWVQETVLHPNFNHESYQNNIGIMILERDITLGSTASIIALPNNSFGDVSSAEQTGWSKTIAGGKSENLQKFTIPLVKKDVCGQSHPSDVICAEAAPEQPGDLCYGDVGNPLVVDGTLYGITLWSFDCGTPFSPWIFTSVAPHVDWINQPITTTEGTTTQTTDSEGTTTHTPDPEGPTTPTTDPEGSTTRTPDPEGPTTLTPDIKEWTEATE